MPTSTTRASRPSSTGSTDCRSPSSWPRHGSAPCPSRRYDDALDDRFELLRSRDRGAPERHRTLTAVIEWSWDLLTDREQRALARLSVFHDGFDHDAAESVLGGRAADDVETLVDQSLLVVAETAGTTRFRALETIREFGALRLQEAGQLEDARAAQEAWAAALAERHAAVFVTHEQYETVDLLLREENNLTDVLRRALARGDGDLVARLVSTLGSLWTVTGNHPRIFAVADAAVDALVDWDPPPHLRSAAHEAAGILIIHLSWMPSRPYDDLVTAMGRWGEPTTPWGRAAHTMFVRDDGDVVGRLVARAELEAEPVVAAMLYLWAALTCENAGEIERAVETARLGLDVGDLTPYLEASLHAELSQLAMVTGDHHAAARHAELAWPPLMRMHAVDDARSLRIGTALAPLMDGDLDTCVRILDEVEASAEGTQMGSRMVLPAARAEVALMRGDVEGGLRLFEESLAAVSDIEMPEQGMTPWVLLAAGGDARRARAPPLGGRRPQVARAARPSRRRQRLRRPGVLAISDLPLNGVLLVALGAWALRFGDPATHRDGVHLLAMGERWALQPQHAARWRGSPSLRWPNAAVPGRVGELHEEYAGRPGAELRAGGREGAGPAHIFRVKLSHRERREDRDDHGAPEQRPADRRRHGTVVGEVADRGDHQRDRVDVGEGAQPADGIVSVGTNALDRKVSGNITISEMPCTPWRCLADGAEPGEDPRQRPAGDHRQQDRRRARRARRHRGGSPWRCRCRRSGSRRSQ